MTPESLPPPPLRVLLVEDNPTDTLVVCDELAHATIGFTVVACARLRAAVTRLRGERFDVVLLDLSLPDSDGLSTLGAINAAAPQVPVVVLSHRDDEALALQAVQAGAQDYLVKGQTEGLLVRALRYAVERARLELERRAAESRLRLLEASIAHLNDIVLITDADPVMPRIVFVNAAFTRLTGYTASEAVGRTPKFLQGPQTERPELDRIAHALAKSEPVRAEVINCTKAGQPYWLEIDIVPLRDGHGVLTHYVAVQRDITERRAFDAHQKENEKRLQLALKGGHLGYWDWNVQEDSLQVGARWQEMLGLDAASTPGSMALWNSLVHPDDVPALQHIVDTVLYNPGGTEFEVTLRARHAQGHYIWILDKGAVFERLPDGLPLRVVGTHMDITRQKESELQIQAGLQALQDSQQQLQTLSRRILHAQETERRRVALELHDDLGQALTAIKINLLSPASIEGRPTTPSEAENVRIVEDALSQVRRLSLALRPSMLDDLGLPAALSWLVQSASANRDLEVHLHCDMAEERIAPEIETACFRIVQESLTNIRRHSRARSVQVVIRTGPRQLELSVHDDGGGFDINHPRSSGFSLGLLGMRERASNVGGHLTVETAPGQGCTVRMHCPLDTAPLPTP